MNPNTPDSFNSIFEEYLQRPRFWEEMAILNFTEALLERLQAAGMSKSELAERMKVSSAYVTKLIGGSNNFTVRTMVKVARSLDCELAINLVPSASYIQSSQPQNENFLRFPAATNVALSYTQFKVVPSVVQNLLTSSGRIDKPEEHADLALAA